MKKDMKKSRPAVDTTERPCSRNENNRKNTINQCARFGKKNIPVIGVYHDSAGRWPAMPILDMPEETPESWNAKVRAQQKRREEGT